MAKKRVDNEREGSWARLHRRGWYRAFSCICLVNSEQQKRRAMGDSDADHEAREELYRGAE
jgi:hypothetical protein